MREGASRRACAGPPAVLSVQAVVVSACVERLWEERKGEGRAQGKGSGREMWAKNQRHLQASHNWQHAMPAPPDSAHVVQSKPLRLHIPTPRSTRPAPAHRAASWRWRVMLWAFDRMRLACAWKASCRISKHSGRTFCAGRDWFGG